MPKEETFPIPLKNIDVARSTHTDLDVLQEKKIDVLECRFEQAFARFLERVHKFYSFERKASQKNTCGLVGD